MGLCQNNYQNWHSNSDILAYGYLLSSLERQAFFIVFSAICWCLRKHRNAICFSQHTPFSVRQWIVVIYSTVTYWTAKCKKEVHMPVKN